ncbi:hypothetical protein H6G93_21070 [Nostoc sp. FACHB-973]|nr:hypothetical protein [Nostoc sp. FACHB-973]
MPLFNLETPNQLKLTHLTRFSGWYIPENSEEIQFKELKSGIKSYQYPSFGLIMQIESVLPYMTQSVWKNRLESIRELLLKEGNNLDSELGKKGREILAAGFFFEGESLFSLDYNLGINLSSKNNNIR